MSIRALIFVSSFYNEESALYKISIRDCGLFISVLFSACPYIFSCSLVHLARRKLKRNIRNQLDFSSALDFYCRLYVKRAVDNLVPDF